MKEIFKTLLKFIFANTKLDEKVAETLETAKIEITKLDQKFDDFKADLEKIPAEETEDQPEVEAPQEISEPAEEKLEENPAQD